MNEAAEPNALGPLALAAVTAAGWFGLLRAMMTTIRWDNGLEWRVRYIDTTP